MNVLHEVHRALRVMIRPRSAARFVMDKVVIPLAGDPPPGLLNGSSVHVDGSPVVLVVLAPADHDLVLASVAAVRAAQASGARFTPVFVLDRPNWRDARRAGYVVEHLSTAFLPRCAALEEIRLTYNPRFTVHGPEDLDSLTPALRGPGGLRDQRRDLFPRVARSLERRWPVR